MTLGAAVARGPESSLSTWAVHGETTGRPLTCGNVGYIGLTMHTVHKEEHITCVKTSKCKAKGGRLTDESLLAEGVLAAEAPWDEGLRGGGVRVVTLPDKDVVALPVILPKEGDPVEAQITRVIRPLFLD